MDRRPLSLLPVLALLGGLLVVAPAPRAVATPVAVDDTTYQLYGRVFPDPHGCLLRMAPWSPWAKGNVCAADFIQFDEMVAGLGFLQEKFPGFIELVRIDERYGNPDYMSAGLATADLSHEPNPLWMVRVTDESVPDKGKKHFLFPLSIHGIERAGVEGGVRAIEDLATWAACERDANASPVCANETPFPHPILETSPDVSISAGDALRKSEVYFVFPNPDGWRRGDRNNGVFYMRYNGNGVDLNRDWPSLGFTFAPYTPFSEPETRSFGEVLKRIRSNWEGGIDLHGQLIDRAFSFTLLGQGPRDFGSNQATLDVVEGAWRDAETRLSWSPLIKANDAPADDNRLYGVQWGTVWDTIGYTTTGAFGDWIGSPIGLGAEVSIDNEMSLSHISNCGVGTCFIPDVEQLHVDGNKSLIYSLINFSFRPESHTFPVAGRAAYLDSHRVVAKAGVSAAKLPAALIGLKPQEDIVAQLDATNDWVHEFDVLGPVNKVLNRGFKVDIRALNVAAISPAAEASTVVERMVKGEWEVVNTYYNQDDLYLQAGQTVDVNDPEPGHWRVRIDGGEAGLLFNASIDFRDAPAWRNPIQNAYSASNLAFFTDLNRYAQRPFTGVSADDILSGALDLSTFDSLVIADDMLPGYVEAARTGAAQASILFAGSDAGPTYPCGAPTTLDPAPPGCEATYEWTVDGTKNNRSMKVRVEWAVSANDFDLYVERYAALGDYWTPVAQSAGGADPEIASLLNPVPGKYRARVVNFASVEPFPQEVEVTFSNDAPKVKAGTRTAGEVKTFAAKLRAFVEGGGNLVLTDSALRLLASMGIVTRDKVHDFSVYAGYIGFTADGTSATYDLPLARNVQRPGAAEGPSHRHQTYEPVPLGFAIQDEAGGDASTAPVWAVDQVAWKALGGVTAGTTTGDQVTLGDLKVGKGIVRVIGALLPMPTEDYFHPEGLADYSVTYAGFQVFQNAIDYTNHGRTTVGGTKTVRPSPGLPATGLTRVSTILGLLSVTFAFAIGLWRRRLV